MDLETGRSGSPGPRAGCPPPLPCFLRAALADGRREESQWCGLGTGRPGPTSACSRAGNRVLERQGSSPPAVVWSVSPARQLGGQVGALPEGRTRRSVSSRPPCQAPARPPLTCESVPQWVSGDESGPLRDLHLPPSPWASLHQPDARRREGSPRQVYVGDRVGGESGWGSGREVLLDPMPVARGCGRKPLLSR